MTLNLPPEFVDYWTVVCAEIAEYKLEPVPKSLFLIRDVLIALSKARDTLQTAFKELDRVHKEARDARDEIERLEEEQQVLNDTIQALNDDLEEIRNQYEL